MRLYKPAAGNGVRGGGVARDTPKTPSLASPAPPALAAGANANPFAEYVCGVPARRAPPKYMRRAPPDAAEWYGLTCDEPLVQILERLPAREGFRFAHLSKQMRRVAVRALESQLGLSPEQTIAFVDAMGGKNVFLTGGAGTGKSHTLRTIVEHLPRTTTAVTASTGCAASLIGATTLHSAVGIGLGVRPSWVYVNEIRDKKPYVFDRLRTLTTLVIDEVSMLDGKLIELVGQVVGGVRRAYDRGVQALCANAQSTAPFEGVQLIVCGDMLQLPPVEIKKGWVFEAKLWRKLAFKNHVLTTIHRQHGDAAFAQILGRMRFGESTPADLDYLVRHSSGVVPHGALKLFATNAPATAENETRLKGLLEGRKPHTFTAIDTVAGRPRRMVCNQLEPNSLLDNCLVPRHLHLAEGARVMCLRNVPLTRIANGSLGEVKAVTVHRDANGAVTGATIKVLFDAVGGREALSHHFRTYDPDPEAPSDRLYLSEFRAQGDRVVASRIQIPLRLAWAISIHKSQGQSLDRVSVDFGKCFEKGQAYVALSRVKALSNAYIRGLTLAMMRDASQKAVSWYRGLEAARWE